MKVFDLKISKGSYCGFEDKDERRFEDSFGFNVDWEDFESEECDLSFGWISGGGWGFGFESKSRIQFLNFYLKLIFINNWKKLLFDTTF